MPRLLVLLTVTALAAAACAQAPQQSSAPPPDAPASEASEPHEQPTVLGSSPRDDQSVEAAAADTGYVSLLAVGDIASCDVSDDEKVATLAKNRSGRVAILGDAVYPNGSTSEFNNCF